MSDEESMPNVGPRAGARERAFFGRRKGHRLRTRQVALLDTLLPRLALALDRPPPGNLVRLFSPEPELLHESRFGAGLCAHAVEAVRLEIGFGGGEHLAAQAAANPHQGFIGCEPFVNGLAKILAAIDARQIRNIRLHPGDCIELLEWLPPASLAGIDLLYPDPWPKRRHWKRRFVQLRTVAMMARVLRPGGEFRFATDVADYAAWTLERLVAAPEFAWTAERADDWRLPWPGFTGTRYETKAKRQGRAPCYLVFRRVP